MKAASKTFKSCIPKDEIENIGLIELWKTTQKSFDSRDKFRSFLYKKIKWACINYVVNEQNFLSRHKLREIFLEESSDSNLVMDILDDLSKQDRDIMRQKYVMDMTLKEVSTCHGESRQAISKKIKRIISSKAQKNS